jgi:FkbM family methyltransferase
MDSDSPSSSEEMLPRAPGAGLLARLLRVFAPATLSGRGGDDRQAALARERFWRETEQDICSCLVLPGDLAIDVGANVGDYVRTFLAAGCRCIAFECNPRLAGLLADRHRGDDRVVIRDEALSSVDGTAELLIPMRWWEESDGGSTIESANKVAIGFWPVKRVSVRRRRLDELVVADVAILKVDVEGHELDVLRGATALLDRCRPALLVECEERHRPGAIGELFGFLAGRGYRGFFILEGRVRPVEEFSSTYQDPAELAKGLPRRRTRYVNNFLFFHESQDPAASVASITAQLDRSA